MIFNCLIKLCTSEDIDLLVVSVATKRTDGYKRFTRSLNVHGYSYEIFGLDEEWKGGDVKRYAGGGHKINILIRELKKYENDDKKILLFTDSYDVIIDDDPSVLVNKFKEFKAGIVFGAEAFCWPDAKLADDYPVVEENEKRFLNSGGIIGYASDFYKIITSSQIKDDEDDQLFYTKLFLNKEFRDQLNIKLDTKSEIFQNLNGAIEEIVFKKSAGGFYKAYNNLTNSAPIVIHGNGPSKLALNYLGNYICESYSVYDGCHACNENTIKLDRDEKTWPTVTLGIFIERPTPFLKEFFQKIRNLKYPKAKISILLHNNIKYHTSQIAEFFEAQKASYALFKYISPEQDSLEYEARAEAIEEFKKNKNQYYFSIDSIAHLDNPETLRFLIEQNKPILTPIMLRKESQWSNFWGGISDTGFYARSPDYLDIVEYRLAGVWNVPFISEAILMTSEFVHTNKIAFEDINLDPDMMFAKTLRDQDVFMYATNMHQFGHLVNPDGFNTTLTRPEMYEIFNNFDDWAARFIHQEYYKALEPESKLEQPCPDVYWFPIVTDEFCASLIDMMETYGQWSGGKNNNYDSRLPGGYENVPTVDIHMKQVNWETHWLEFLRKFILPMQQKIFTGYYHDPPTALLNFVVRYRPGEQDQLRPHHDASTYTINIALNRPNVDFEVIEGGGCRFVRYNCSVIDTRIGWTFIHPGRLTHYHEGLKVTKGTRYIMVSFVDP